MAVLDKDTLMSRLKDMLKDDASDEALSFCEDISDTFNSLDGGEDWKAKYEQNDKEWRERYRARFFEPTAEKEKDPAREAAEDEAEQQAADRASTIKIDDLFKEE